MHRNRYPAIRSFAASLVFATLGCAAWAQSAATPAAATPSPSAVLHVRALAATCANCHGTNGKAPDGAAVLSLAGVQKDYIVAQMAAFKSGARTATVMHQLSKGYSDSQIEQIAIYFAAQKK